jgi:phosphoserine aminotransferase
MNNAQKPQLISASIVREDLLLRPHWPRHRLAATACRRSRTCINTPPTLAIHLAALVFDWIAESGGACLAALLDQ